MWFRQKQKFKTLAKEVLEQKKLRAPMTYACARFRLNRLTKHFGNLELSKIEEAHWHAYVLKRLTQRPGSKFFDDKKYMRQVMLEAYRRGLVKRQVRLIIPDLPSSIGREITERERENLFKHASEALKFQMWIARLMGLRLREMLHLRWDQFDWGRVTINFLPSDTKTRAAREVPINPDLVSEFKRRFFVRTSPYVFPHPHDPSRAQNDNRVAWRTCKRKASVTARWHDWRHSCATEMLRRGKTPQAAGAYLGMSEKVLTRIYQHLNIEDLRDVAKSMSTSEHPQIREKSALPSHG